MALPRRDDINRALPGKDFLVEVYVPGIIGKWHVLGGQRGGSLDIEADTVDMTESRSDGWSWSRPAARSWKLDITTLFMLRDEARDYLRTAIETGTPVFLRIRDSTDVVRSGRGIITDAGEDWAHDAAAEFSVTIEGLGPLTNTTGG